MSKKALKARLALVQGGVCALTDEALSPVLALVDTDRIVPKVNGGVYDPENTRIVEPRAHMHRHGTLRTRPQALDELKSLFDDRVQMMKLLLKVNNQILAYKRRTDQAHPETEAFLEEQLKPFQARLDAIDRSLGKALAAFPDKFTQAAMNVPGLGPISVAALVVYVDLEKAATPSSLWKYVGLHVASHERYVKGEAGGGNKTLRTVLWNTANVMMRLGGPYRDVYDAVKARLSVSEKMVNSRNTEGKLVTVAWKDAKPSHRHGAALRVVVKHLLADYWFVGRTMAGLPTVPLYAESMLGHTHIVAPAERGWQF